MPRSGSAAERAETPQAPAGSPAGSQTERRAGGLLRRLAEDLVLRAHGLAVRFDALPDEFGKAGEVDEHHAQAVLGEWLRCLRTWADYNPEEVFAVKVGAALLAGALFALWAVVGLLR